MKLAFREDLDIYYACKIVAKSKLAELEEHTRFEREIRLLQQLHHPRIVQLYDLLQDDDNYYLFMEYCPNGDLLSHIVSQKQLSEREARRIFKQILDAVQFIHFMNIGHRDIKPENILMDSEGNAKLSDFGLSKYVGESGMTSTSCGSPCYASPEVLSNKQYNAKKADMWSCGVLLYAMVTGHLPWSHRNQIQLFKAIETGTFRIPSHLSPECASLMKGLINTEVDARYTAEDALDSNWMKDTLEETVCVRETPLLSLKKLDQFFHRELSECSISIPQRCKSFGKAVTHAKYNSKRHHDQIQTTGAPQWKRFVKVRRKRNK